MSLIAVLVIVLLYSAYHSITGLISACIICFYISYQYMKHIESSLKTVKPPESPSKENIQIRTWEVTSDSSLSEAFSDLFDEIFQQYIHIWYDHLTTSQLFVAEIRSILRNIVAVIYGRALDADWSLLKSETLPKITSLAAFYIDSLAQDKHLAPSEIMRILPENKLHPALKSLRHEEAHLKEKLQKLARFAFPNISNTGVQVLCDILVTNVIIPGINLAVDKEMGYRIVIEASSALRKKIRKELVKVGLDENGNDAPTWKRRKSCANKIILYNFGSRGFSKTENSIFVLSIRQILEDHQMFYSFKCWLQKYHAVSLLNFVHKFEDFNRRFFGQVEFQDKDLSAFHKELSSLMNIHFSKGPCCIPISSKIIEDLKSIIFGKQQTHENLIKASRPLTLAYNTTLYLLEEYYLPDFCHGVFFNDSSLACGNAAHEILGPRDAQVKVKNKLKKNIQK